MSSFLTSYTSLLVNNPRGRKRLSTLSIKSLADRAMRIIIRITRPSWFRRWHECLPSLPRPIRMETQNRDIARREERRNERTRGQVVYKSAYKQSQREEGSDDGLSSPHTAPKMIALSPSLTGSLNPGWVEVR